MKNISVFIKGGTKTLTFIDPIVTYGSLITTNEVTVFWKFKNITDEIDNKKFTKGSVEVELGEGYWDFEQIKNRLAGEKLELTMNVHDNTCDIVNKTKSKVNLKKFGKLLGFPENKELSADESITHKSPKPVDVNHGLRYLIVTCDLVDKSKNMDLDGVKSDVLAFLPVTRLNMLKGVIRLTSRQKQRLSRYKKEFRSLGKKSVSVIKKRKLLNQKGGGAALAAILPIALAVLAQKGAL